MNEEKEQKIRSNLQNKALHLAFRIWAEKLNNAGIEPELFFKNFMLIHTEHTMKDAYRAVGKQIFGKESTGTLTQQEVNILNEVFIRHAAQFGVEFEFPSHENQQLMKFYEKERT